MNSLILACQFLTRVPIPLRCDFNEKEGAKSLLWFPVISLFIGILVGIVHDCTFYLSPMISGFLSLLTLYLLNGGLHIDGLCDIADGFLANKDEKETLNIMHDSKIGTYAVLALVLVLLGKFSALSSKTGGPLELGILFASARMGMLLAVYFFPSHKDSQLGKIFQTRANKSYYFIEWVAFAGLIVLLKGTKYLLLPLTSAVVALLLSKWAMKKISGVTGDVYGAITEIGECVLLLLYGGWF